MSNSERLSKTVLKRADISTRESQAIDLEGRYQQIIGAIAKQIGFIPQQELGKSRWWGKKVGAVLYKGHFPVDDEQRSAVLKIEAVKLEPDEIAEPAMIHLAEQALAGSGIRPPKIYGNIPWSDEHGGYAAIIMEDVPTDSLILPLPGTEQDIAAMMDVRRMYRDTLKRNQITPWVAKEFQDDTDNLSRYVTTKFSSWKQTARKIFPDHPFREPGDDQLIDRAVTLLEKGYRGVALEFQQAHFSHRDVVRVGDEIVMFSNLYWDWRAPFYDAVFPSHWYMYDLAQQPGVTTTQLQQQKALWEYQYKEFTASLSPEDKRLFALARLERFAAGLNLDALSVSDDPSNEIARYIVKQTRKDLTEALIHNT